MTTLDVVGARHSPGGEVLEDAVQRLIDISIDGGFLAPDQEFYLYATIDNNYRI